MNIYIKKILLIFFFSIVAFFLSNWKMPQINYLIKLQKITNVSELSIFLDNLSQKEKDSLDFLFRYFFENNFGYTLFGNKPISVTSINNFNFYNVNTKKIYPLYEIAGSYCNTYHPYNIKLRKAWKVWKKYQNLFSNSPFILFETSKKINVNTSIFIINKRATIEIINFYKEDFKSVLKTDSDPQIFINNLIKTSFTNKHSNLNHALLGILLGYGKNNALNFQKRLDLYKNTNSFAKQEIKELNMKMKSFAKQDHEEFEQELLKKMIENYQGSKDEFIFTHFNFYPQLLPLPSFFADPNDTETQQIEENFKKIRKKIQEAYKGKNFLEVTLCQFITQSI